VAVTATIVLPRAAMAAPTETYACDAMGPVTVDRLWLGGSRGFPVWGYLWSFSLSGKCRSSTGATFDVGLSATTNTPGLTNGMCGTAAGRGPQAATPDFDVHGGLTAAATGQVQQVQMRWSFTNPLVSSYSPFSGSGSATDNTGPSTITATGVEANRIFLRCPTTWPDTSNGRFLFTLGVSG
jgi:hypothetical protein